MATRPVANDDILRLRAALDVALTTLSSCAHENTNAATHSNDAPAPANQHDAPNMSSSSAGANMECSDADCREELVARIKHLEEHILKKSVEEVELAQKMMEQENIMANQTTQVQEYEQKLAEALPLLESLEQSRDETKEARRKASLATEQNVQLRHTNKHLEEEVVRLKQAREEAAATQADLEKQLESEREESLWLSEVEARQMREMEAKSEDLQQRLCQCELDSTVWKTREVQLCERLEHLEMQMSNDAKQVRFLQGLVTKELGRP